MRDFRIILGYELRQLLLKRSAIVTTVVLMALALVGTSVPRIMAAFDKGGEEQVAAYDSTLVDEVGYVFQSQEQQAEYTAMLGLKEDNFYPDRQSLVDALKAKELKVGFVMEGETSFEAIYQDRGMEDQQDTAFSRVVGASYREKQLASKGLTVEEFTQIENFSPDITTTVMGVTVQNNVLLAMILMVMVYILVLLYGNITSVVIAREKDSKAMELLITSTRPTSLIFGKVAAAGISGVLQFGLVILCAGLGFYMSREYYDPMLRAMLSGSLTTSYVTSYLFFAIAGYLLYLFVFAALGSTVSRVEDVSSATAVVQIIMVLGYVASTFVMADPYGAVAKFTSMFPFTSIIVMPMRVGLATVPMAEQLIAAALMLAFVAFFAWLSVKIYRWGTLNYGNKTNIFKVLKSVFSKQGNAA